MATSTPTPKKTDDNWLGEEGNTLPTGLNVLTILTFIWNGLFGLLSFYTFASASGNYQTMQQNQDKIPDFMKRMMGPHPLETARLATENRFPILIISLIGYFLCFYGALLMRKRKKTGFSLYILGDIVPFSVGIFMGFDIMATVSALVGTAIVLIFVILYAFQLKYMK
jgi:hypothetical protein